MRLPECQCGKQKIKGRSLCRDCLNKRKRYIYANNEKYRNKLIKHAKDNYDPKKNKDRYHHYRRLAFEKLGGYKCSICGFDDPRALQIDHIDNSGYIKRKQGESGETLYKKILDGNDGFQVLCANCNWIKKAEYEGRSLEYYFLTEFSELRKFTKQINTEDVFGCFDGYESMSNIATKLHMSRNTIRNLWVEKFGETPVIERCKRVQSYAASKALTAYQNSKRNGV
jgi:hypothetical protein